MQQRLIQRALQVEALLYLLCARLALALIPFEQLTWFLNRRSRGPALTGDTRIRVRQEVRAAIRHVRSRLPWETTCFQRAIAAQAMLRRRRVGTTLYYGAVTLPDRGLTAHTWVKDGTEAVIGVRTAERDGYQVLARYPEPSSYAAAYSSSVESEYHDR